MHRKVFALLMTLLLLLSFASCSFSPGDRFLVKYGTGENGVYLKEFTGTSTDIIYKIDDTYQGKPVVELVDFAVSNSEYLQELYFGKNVKIISHWAITNCPLLKTIHVSKDNQYFTSVNGVLFTKDMETILCYPNMKGS